MKRIIRIASISTVVAACGSGPVLPADVGLAGDGELARTFEFVRTGFDIPSLGGMLVKGSGIIEMEAVGIRALGHPEDVTEWDRWHIGSITKAMTATLAGIYVERGALSWSTTVQEVFPDLATSMRGEYRDVRLDELLYHTSGLPEDVQVPSWPTFGGDPSLKVQRRQFAAELLQLAPGSSRGTHVYTNAGYIVAGAMLEETAGEAWEELMRREIFDVLGMLQTGFGAPGHPGERDAPWGHWETGEGWKTLDPGEPDADNPAAMGPAGTVHTSFTDYAQYLVQHLAGARGDDGLVSAATFEKLHTPAAGTEYSLGWGVGTRDWAGGRTLAHSGSNLRWFAVVWIAPERNFAMLAVTNAGGDAAADATDAVIQALIRRHDGVFR